MSSKRSSAAHQSASILATNSETQFGKPAEVAAIHRRPPRNSRKIAEKAEKEDEKEEEEEEEEDESQSLGKSGPGEERRGDGETKRETKR